MRAAISNSAARGRARSTSARHEAGIHANGARAQDQLRGRGLHASHDDDRRPHHAGQPITVAWLRSGNARHAEALHRLQPIVARDGHPRWRRAARA
jgi:hypothetical protein